MDIVLEQIENKTAPNNDKPSKDFNSNYTQNALIRVVSNYIPYQNVSFEKLCSLSESTSEYVSLENEGVKNLENLLKNGDQSLKQFGTAEELAANLKIYRNFTGNYEIFRFHAAEPYNNTIMKYQSLKNKQYTNKRSIFQYIFQELMTHQPLMLEEAVAVMIMIYIKTYESRLSECCEFIEYDSTMLQNLSTKLIRDMSEAQQDLERGAPNSEVRKLIASNRLDKMLTHFLDFLRDPTDAETTAVREVFQKHFQRIKKEQIAIKMFFAISAMIKAIDVTVAAYTNVVLPFSKTRDPRSVIAVRVFEDDSGQFVIKSELFKAINIRDPARYPLRGRDPPGIYLTMSTDVDGEFSSFSDRIKNVEFIRVPIQKTKYAAVPIPAPNGGHCIPAADAFLELLRPLILNRKIFQKITKDMWFNLRALLCRLESFFFPEIKRKFLVDAKVVQQLRYELSKFCDPYDKISAKNVRDVSKEGFTAEDLKNELEYLGFIELFPNIQDHIDRVHMYLTSRKKKGDVLTTSDLFDAIEKCVILSVMEVFPNLALFIHHQEECDRFLVKCEKCSTSKKYTGGKWTEYIFSDVIPVYDESEPENRYNFKLICGKKMVLSSNYKFFTKEEIKNKSIKYFGMSHTEAVEISERGVLKQEHLDNKILSNLTNFLKFNNEKMIFVRAIPSTQCDSKKRVFVQEISEILKYLLERDSSKVPAEHALETIKTLEKFGSESTISLLEFEYLCENLEVDKSQITIVPDPVYEFAVHQFLTVTKNQKLDIFGPTGTWIMRSQQAVFHIFQEVICDVNWSKNICEKHQKCLTALKKTVMAVMAEYLKLEEGQYVTVDKVEEQIAELKTHCYFQHRKSTETPFTKLHGMEYMSKIPYSAFRLDCEAFGLHKYMKSPSGPKDKELYAIVARNRYFVSFFQQFHDPLNYAINDAIINELKFKYTDLQVMRADFSLCVIELPQKTFENFAVHITPHPTRSDKNPRAEVQKPVMSNSTENQVNRIENDASSKINDDPSDSEEIEHSEDVTTEESKEEYTYDELVKENERLRAQLKVSSNVRADMTRRYKEVADQNETLLDGILELGNALESERNQSPETDRDIINVLRKENTELRIAQSTLTDANTVSNKKIKELEFLLQREQEKVSIAHGDIVLLKNDLMTMAAENKTCARDQEKLIDHTARIDIELDKKKEEVQTLTKCLQQLKQKQETEASELVAMNEELEDHKTQLLEKVSELEAELENERKTKEETQEQGIQVDFESADTNRVLKALEDTNIRLLSENRDKNHLIEDILERVVSNTTCSPSSSMLSRPPSIVGEPENGNESVLALLAQLQKTKENYQEEEQIQMARDMAEKLRNLPNRPDIRILATYELQQYEGRIREYCQSIEMLYQKLKKTKDASSVPRLPELPSFSERFMNQYCKYMDTL